MSDNRHLTVKTSHEIARLLGHVWVQHPAGYSVYVPEGAEHFFDLIAEAIQRAPETFTGSLLSGNELFECLNARELAMIVGWLHEVSTCAEYSAQFDRGRGLPLYGWAMAKQQVALKYLWLQTDRLEIGDLAQRP